MRSDADTCHAHLATFLAHLLARDTKAAVDVATSLAADGVAVSALLGELVAPALVEVGDRWHRDEISVADEHAATAVADAVVSVLTAAATYDTGGPMVVVSCAEGEWHSLAARLFAELLRAAGHPVIFVGPSIPPAHLARFLEQAQPDVLAVSCSTPAALDGVLSCVHVAHDLGIPVFAGGRALGPDDRRAVALGSDLWAPTAGAAVEVLRRPLPTSLREPTADTGTAMELALARPALVAAAVGDVARQAPLLAKVDRDQRTRAEEDLLDVLRFAEAAVLTGDARVFTEFLAWLEPTLAARGLPAGTLALTLGALSAHARHPALTRLLDDAQRGARLR